ncbi:MAG: amidohydrolase family protein [Candidatus Hydrogenedentes bacterium]|nr:amidohydrolase family protein [Candidatus Hydrogenedentota bacterium]
MIIDCHNHPDWHGHDLVKFLANMDRFGIDRTWLLSWEAPPGDYDPNNLRVTPQANSDGPIPFSRCLYYVERAPDKFVLGYAPDPRRPEAIDLLDAAINAHGVRVYGELKLRMTYDNPDALRMYRFCGEKKLPVTVHIDYEFPTGHKYPRPNWWYGGGIEAFERAVRACPETIFLGHAPGFWAHISGDDKFDREAYPAGKVVPGGKLVQMLRTYPNLCCDLSAGSGLNALKRDPEFAKEFLIEFQGRLLYGRDFFDNAHQEFLNGRDLPQDVLEKIYFQNAARLVSLDAIATAQRNSPA